MVTVILFAEWLRPSWGRDDENSLPRKRKRDVALVSVLAGGERGAGNRRGDLDTCHHPRR